MTHPFKSQSKTGQQMAKDRYSFKAKPVPEGILLADAKKDAQPGDVQDNYIAAPARQISETGKVRK
jgi:hypothetical protein